jgi:hypothetical protein
VSPHPVSPDMKSVNETGNSVFSWPPALTWLPQKSIQDVERCLGSEIAVSVRTDTTSVLMLMSVWTRLDVALNGLQIVEGTVVCEYDSKLLEPVAWCRAEVSSEEESLFTYIVLG